MPLAMAVTYSSTNVSRRLSSERLASYVAVTNGDVEAGLAL